MSSSLEGKTYDEIFGKEKGEMNKAAKREKLINAFIPFLQDELKSLNLELIDESYGGAYTDHRWRCMKCGNEFIRKWNNLKCNGYRCRICQPFDKNQKKIVICKCGEKMSLSIYSNKRLCDECKKKKQ